MENRCTTVGIWAVLTMFLLSPHVAAVDDSTESTPAFPGLLESVERGCNRIEEALRSDLGDLKPPMACLPSSKSEKSDEEAVVDPVMCRQAIQGELDRHFWLSAQPKAGELREAVLQSLGATEADQEKTLCTYRRVSDRLSGMLDGPFVVIPDSIDPEKLDLPVLVGHGVTRFGSKCRYGLITEIRSCWPSLPPSGGGQEAAEPASLLQAIESQCEVVEAAMYKALAAGAVPDACKKTAANGGDTEVEPPACREKIALDLTKAVQSLLDSTTSSFRLGTLSAIEATSSNELQALRLYREVDEKLSDVKVATLQQARVVAQTMALGSTLEPQGREVASRFGRLCRAELSSEVATTLHLADLEERLQDQAESALVADLTKEEGFSRIVECRWNDETGDLDCNPGLRLGGEDASVIRILPPINSPEFRFAKVWASAAEETYTDDPVCGCGAMPCLCDVTLTRDDLPLERRRSAEIDVHFPRMIGTSYGCAYGSDLACAVRKLRDSERRKLSLVLRGKTPIITVRAEDGRGRVATGKVLVGYQRWRVETGGFLAIGWEKLDRELVTRPVNGQEGRVRVAEIRDSDNFSQDTGIFINLIPGNYEVVGVSLGFAIDEKQAPSVFLGPTIRLRTFGQRGVASLTFGAALRQVDRFPGVSVGDIYPENDAALKPDKQFELAPFIGLQLGFSFGPIQVPGEE